MTMAPLIWQNNIAGARVRQARIACGFSQGDLAVQLQVLGINLTQQSISRMEKGERFITDYELLTLSQVLRRDIYWMLGEEKGE